MGSARSTAITVRSVFSCVASRNRGGSIGPPPAGFAEKNPTFECRAAPGLPRGEASTRATLWVAVVQLTAHLQTTNRESSASGAVPSGTPIGPDGQESSARRPHPLRLCKTPIGVPSGTDRAGDAKHRERLSKILSPKLGQDLPLANRRHPKNRTAARKPRSQIARPSAAPRGGRNFVAAPPATGPSPKKNLAPRSLAARWVYFGRPRGFHLDCALAQRAKSLLRRAGDRCRSAHENWSLLRQLPPCG